jgi:hypothetical protein
MVSNLWARGAFDQHGGGVYGHGRCLVRLFIMRLVLALAMLGLSLGVVHAQARDVAAEPAYPAPDAPETAKPKASLKTAPKATLKVHPAPAAVTPTPAPKPAAAAAPAEMKSETPLVAAFGWSVVVDPVTGIRLGIPGKLMPETSRAANGTRWSSRHGEFQLETFRIKTSESLATLFERQKSESARKIESSASRDDGFVLSGLQGLKQFAVRAQIKEGELRGYTLLYDQAMAGIMLPVLPAMAGAFAPFPDGAAPIASLSQPVAYGTGVIVSAQGHIITDRRFADGCDVIKIPGLGVAERMALDHRHGLALLRVYGKREVVSAGLAPEGAVPRELTLIGIPDPQTQDGGDRRTEIKAELTDGNALRLREPMPVAGLSGAAALDPQGRVLGIMQMRNAPLASAEPAAPPVRLVAAADIRDFLAANKVVPPSGAGGGKAAVVRVICVRP